MSADLALFAISAGDDETIDVWDQLRSVELISSDPDGPGEISFEDHGRLWRYVETHTKSIEVGQVSWIKAGLAGDVGRYVPAPILRATELIGDGVWLTPGLAKAITVAFNLPNRSIYGHVEHVRITRKNEANVRMLEEFRRNSYPGQHRRYPYDPVWLPGDILRYGKGRGLAKGSVVKRFLQENMGCYLVQESV